MPDIRQDSCAFLHLTFHIHTSFSHLYVFTSPFRHLHSLWSFRALPCALFRTFCPKPNVSSVCRFVRVSCPRNSLVPDKNQNADQHARRSDKAPCPFQECEAAWQRRLGLSGQTSTQVNLTSVPCSSIQKCEDAWQRRLALQHLALSRSSLRVDPEPTDACFQACEASWKLRSSSFDSSRPPPS